MNIQLLKDNLARFIALRNELAELKPGQGGYTLMEYVELLQDRIRNVDYSVGDTFAEPGRIAIEKLDLLRDKDAKREKVAFATVLRDILSLADQYIKGFQHALQLHDQGLM